MSVICNDSHIQPRLYYRDYMFFRPMANEKILPPCAPENSVELCFYCIEGQECPEHPNHRETHSEFKCFTDNEFCLVDEKSIKNVHKIECDEEDLKKDIFLMKSEDVEVKDESFDDIYQSASTSTPKTRQNDHCHEELLTVGELPRKRFSRFRKKTFMCDVCEAAFTLKQNVQTHLFIYHVQKDGSLKQHTRLMYKCDNCEKRMMLEAHAANGTILPNFGHVYPNAKDIPMPLLPLSRGDSRAGNVSPASQLWRKDSVCAHKRQNLEMKISLLKKRKERLIEAQAKDDLKPNGSLESESTVDEVKNAEDSEASRESSDIKNDLLFDVAGGTDTDVEVGTDQVFKSPHAAEVHFKKTHKKPSVRPPTDCEECGKKFASAFQLREHISIQHLKERNFVCEECGQKFGRRGGLRRHVQMVHQNHLHMCPYEGCDHPGYKCSKALTAHIRSVHTNIRPYVCETCQKAFVRRNDLKMHTLTHTSETAFHCECGSKFRRLIYLKKHQRLCSSRNNAAKPTKDETELQNGSAKNNEVAADQNL